MADPIWWCTCSSRPVWRHSKSCLDQRDQRIIDQYLGSHASLDEIGRHFGLTRQRLHQIFAAHGRRAKERPSHPQQMLTLLREGKSLEEVAQEFNVTVQTVRNATRKQSRTSGHQPTRKGRPESSDSSVETDCRGDG